MHRAIISSPTALGKILGSHRKTNLKLSTMFCKVYSGRHANASECSSESGSLRLSAIDPRRTLEANKYLLDRLDLLARLVVRSCD